MTPAAAASGVPLPTRADVIAAFDPTTVFGPKPGEFPNRSPGPISGRETVTIGLASDGAVRSIVVQQRLVIQGTGDYTLEIPGPATEVEAPPDARAQPGLRRGSVIWEGFSPGERVLESTITLDLREQRFLGPPLTVRARVLSKGAPVAGLADGPVRIEVRIENATRADRPVTAGVPDARALGSTLDAIHAALRAGRAPVAGEGAIPARLPGTADADATTMPIQIPFRLRGTISFPSGTLLDADGAPLLEDGVLARFDETVPSVRWQDGAYVFSVEGTARDLPAPQIRFEARASLPDPLQAAPVAGSWQQELRDADSAILRTDLARAQRLLWQVLRAPEYDAFLGNPKGGPSEAVYRYEPARVRSGSQTPRAPEPRPLAITVTGVALAAAIAGATKLWLRS